MAYDDARPWLSPALRCFWQAGTYRLIRRLRRRALDLTIAVPLVVAGLVWEWRRDDTRPLPSDWAEISGHAWVVVSQPHQGPRWLDPDVALPVLDRWINDLHAAAWFPVLLALLLHLVLRGRVKHVLNDELLRDAEGDQRAPTREDWWRVTRRLLLVPVLAAAIAVWLLWDGYGAWTARYVPLLVGVGAALLIGWMDSKVRMSLRTSAGFRVPARMLVHRRGRRAVRDVAFQHTLMQSGLGWLNVHVTVDGQPEEPHREEGEGPGRAHAAREKWLWQGAERFHATGGARSLGWFIAWAVETCVHTGDMDTAEDLLRHVDTVPQAADTKACRAARAAFLDAVGAHDLAAQQWHVALNTPGRTPLALRVMASHRPGDGDHETRRPSAWWLIRLAWWQTGQLLVTELAGRLELDWPRSAQDTGAARLEEIAEAVAMASVTDDSAVYAAVTRARARALQSLGERRAAAGEDLPAADAYVAAVDAYLQVKDPGGVGRALASACLHLASAARTTPSDALHAVDLLRVALGLMEEYRAALRRPEHRTAIADQDAPLHDAVMDLLAEDRRCPAAKRAELALWLMESRRRAARDHMLADPVVPTDIDFAQLWHKLEQHESAQHVPPPGPDWFETWQQALASGRLVEAKKQVWSIITALHAALPAPAATDTAALLERAGDGVVLAFRTQHRPTGWTVDVVMASPRTGLSMHRAVLAAPDAPYADPTAAAHNAAHTLDALARVDRTAVGHLTRHVECDLLAWSDIAAALLPPALGEALTAPRHSSRRRPVLIVVPDGPIAALPLAGLPLNDRELLGERALVTLTPSLAALKDPVGRPAPQRSPEAIVHLDAEALHTYSTEMRLHHTHTDRVRFSADRRSLFDALRSLPRADVALIAAHGESIRTQESARTEESAHDVSEELPRLADGTTLSATTALGLPWPDTVLLGTCWVSRMETAFGRDPVSFPMSCLLAGAHTVVGATGPLHDAVASDLFGGVTADILDGTNMWTSFHGRLSRHLRNAFGEAAVPAAGAGIALWTLRPPVAPAARPYSITWNGEGLTTSTSEDPAASWPSFSGRELGIPAASGALTIALRHAARTAGADVVDTLALTRSIAVTDPVSRWEDLFTTPTNKRPPTAPSTPEPSVDVQLSGGDRVQVTATVAAVLDIAEQLRRCLGDEWIHPQHAMYGLLQCDGSKAHRNFGWSAATPDQWSRRLAAHAFDGQELPPLSELPFEDLGGPERPHEELLGDDIMQAVQRLGLQFLQVVLITAAAVGIILGFFLPGLEDLAHTPSLGVQYRPVSLSDGSVVREIIWTVDGGPAESAGLRAGDLVIQQGPLMDKQVTLTVSAPPGSLLRPLTLTPVIPRCSSGRCER